jgi:uncharacterized protein
MPTTHLLYLHGFRSSPLSTKAQMVAKRVRADHSNVTWWCPQLPASPREAMELVAKGTAAWPIGQTAVVGSSLGGFYATVIAGRLKCKCVVLNPAVHPSRDLGKFIGEQASWHDPAERFFFHPDYVDELRALETEVPAVPQDTLAVIAKGDEVLDWREMTARYPGSRIRLLEGSDHALSDFDQQIDEVFAFLDLA